MSLPTVFISYKTSVSKGYVDLIAKCLESRGIDVWYAPRDVQSDYPREIVDAIGCCKVFLFVLNKYSNKSQHCMNEASLAFEHVNKNEPISLLVFRTDDSELEGDIKYFLTRTHCVDGTLPPMPERINELCDRIEFMIRGMETKKYPGYGEIKRPETVNDYSLQSDCIYPDRKFVGRSGELELIHRTLSGNINKIILTGMGGIGKTETAKKYVNCYRQFYDDVIWIDYNSSLAKTIADDSILSIENLSKEYYPKMEMHEYYEKKLHVLKRIATEKTLIVVDDLDNDRDPDFDDFCNGSYTLIFTSRYKELSDTIPEMEIKAFENREDLKNLFLTEYKRNLSVADKKIVEYLINKVGRHTFCIRLLAGAMQKKRIRPENVKNMQEIAPYIAKEKVEDMLTKLLGFRELSAEEEYILENLSLVPSQGIEVTQFADWCGIDDYDEIDSLIQASIIIHNPVEDKIHLHPIIRGIFLRRINADASQVSKYIQSLLKKCRYTHVLKYQEKIDLHNLIDVLDKEISSEAPQRNEITYWMAMMKMDLCLYKEAEDIFKKLLEIEDIPVRRARILNKLAMAADLRGEALECITISTKAKDEITGYPSPDNSEKQRSYYLRSLLDRLCESCCVLNQYEKAVEYARESVKMSESLQKNRERATGWSLYHLANALYGVNTGEAYE